MREWQKRREETYKKGDLPYSFSYKIVRYFNNVPCPMCGYEMYNSEGNIHAPTVQHNKPIAKGGEHKITNISVICRKCNISLGVKETRINNTEEVIKIWELIK